MVEATPKGWVDFEAAQQVRFEVVLEHLGFETVQQRGDEHKGICPLPSHTGTKEKPSFSVNFAKQVFTCFGCQAKGTVWTFAKAYCRTDNPKVAAQWLLDLASQEDTRGQEAQDTRETDTDRVLSAFDQGLLLGLLGGIRRPLEDTLAHADSPGEVVRALGATLQEMARQASAGEQSASE